MDPVIQKFRGSLGGFNRRDVLRYIEQISVLHRKELTEMQKELTRCEKERQALEHTLAGLEDEKGSAAAEEARVRSSLEEATLALSRLRGELNDTETKLTAARGELQVCQSQVAELAPMAENYQQLKDRVATVELDAHRKAQATVDEAKAQAEQIRQETSRWLEGVLDQYGAVRSAMDELFRSVHVLGELEKKTGQTDSQVEALKDMCVPK